MNFLIPDKKQPDNEIIKACKNCLHLEVCIKNITNAFPDTTQEEIDLVLEREGCCKDFMDKDLINRLQAENEQFKIISHGCCPTNQNINIAQIKAEAYKEVEENIDKITWYHINKNGELVMGANSETDTPLYKAKDIHNLLKELVGDTDES